MMQEEFERLHEAWMDLRSAIDRRAERVVDYHWFRVILLVAMFAVIMLIGFELFITWQIIDAQPSPSCAWECSTVCEQSEILRWLIDGQ